MITFKHLTILTRIKVKDKSSEKIKKVLLKLIDGNLTDLGCVNSDLHQKTNNKNVFILYENWEKKSHWLDHLKSERKLLFDLEIENCVAQLKIEEMKMIQ
ncbi:antibiotic biosynthesis monooxygenase [Flavobacteriaceae bacterium]|nr:antibiotic biosynthesis monooxygenase [Flavobacteriaceae bacterium]